MKKAYRLVGIVHSGIKGDRGTPVTEDKYDGLINAKVEFDPDNIVVGSRFNFDVIHNPYYDWWSTSDVLHKDYDEEDGVWVVETFYSIYYFQEKEHCL